MQALHKVNIIHRDVKLDNVLFNVKTGVCKLADLGVAVQLRYSSATENMVVGSRGYFAPEMLKESCHWYDIAADVFSLGALMYVLLTARLPFFDARQGTKEYKVRVLNEPLNLEANYDTAKLSVAAKSLLQGILEKNPAQRLTIGQVLVHPWLNHD